MTLMARTPMTNHLFACEALTTADESDCYCPPGATDSTDWEHELIPARPRHRENVTADSVIVNAALCECWKIGVARGLFACPAHDATRYSLDSARHYGTPA